MVSLTCGPQHKIVIFGQISSARHAGYEVWQHWARDAGLQAAVIVAAHRMVDTGGHAARGSA